MDKMEICTRVTDKILAIMAEGTIPWIRPWSGVFDGAIRHECGKPYSLLNQILLEEPGEYLTFNMAKKEGGHIKKGAKGKMIVFYDVKIKKETNDKGEEESHVFPVMRCYTVFHIRDTVGIKPKWEGKLPDITIEAEPNAESVIETYLKNNPTLILERDEVGNRAFYRPSEDKIVVPAIKQFESVAEYYSTTFHEMTHSTGAESRLNRLKSGKDAAFGSETYSKEELVAEIGAATLNSFVGIDTASSIKNSAAYIQNWSARLKAEPDLFITAMTKADKAVKYILNIKEDN